MLAAIARYFPAQTRVSQPAGGYFLWLELPEQTDSLKLFQMALAQGISIAPGPIFSATQRFRNCIRLRLQDEHAVPFAAVALPIDQLSK